MYAAAALRGRQLTVAGLKGVKCYFFTFSCGSLVDAITEDGDVMARVHSVGGVDVKLGWHLGSHCASGKRSW